jgi:hypothetical protein
MAQKTRVTSSKSKSRRRAPAQGAASAMPQALVDGFHWAFLGGAGIAVAGAVLTLALIRDEEVVVEAPGEPAIEGA